MKADLVSIKITPTALRTLRIIAAHTDETQYQVLERILPEELARVVAQEEESVHV